MGREQGPSPAEQCRQPQIQFYHLKNAQTHSFLCGAQERMWDYGCGSNLQRPCSNWKREVYRLD